MNSFILTSDKNTAVSIIVKLTGFIVIGLIVFSIVAFGISKFTKEPRFLANEFSWNSELPKFALSDTRLILLGSSHAGAIDKYAFNRQLRSFSTARQSLLETNKILKDLEHSVGPELVILMPISAIALNQETGNGHLKFNRTRSDAYLSILTARNYLQRISYIFYSWNRNSRRQSKLLQREQRVSLTGDFLSEKTTKIVDWHIESQDPKAHFRNLKHLQSLLETSFKMKSCLVLYESPVSKPYTEKINKRLPDWRHWKSDIHLFVNKNKDQYCVRFVTNIWTEGLSNNPKYYKDADHLNAKGAEIFTKKVKHYLYEKIQSDPAFIKFKGELELSLK